MANTKFVLDKIKNNDEVKSLIASSESEYISVTYNGTSMTLTQALNLISTEIQNNAARLAALENA